MPQPVASRERAWRNTILRVRASGMLPALILVATGFHILSGGRLLTGTNIGVLLHQAAINTVLAAGMTVVVLAGGIDLSVSSVLAASAVAGLMGSHLAGLAPLWPLAALAVGFGFGLMNGLLIGRLGLPPFMLTLATSTVVLGAARAVTGDTTVYTVTLPYSSIGSAALLGVPVLALVAVIVIVVAWFVLTRTVLGRWIYALGGNPAAARLSGIPVMRVTLSVYGLSGLSGGVGAVMLASMLHGANAMQVGPSYTLDAITAVVLGGTSLAGGIGSIGGTAVGALLIAVLSNGLILTGVPDRGQAVVKGLVIIAAVALDGARLGRSARA